MQWVALIDIIRKFCSHKSPDLLLEPRGEGSFFSQSMLLANELVAVNPDGLNDLLRVLLRPLQSEIMVDVVEKPAHQARSWIRRSDFFMRQTGENLFSEHGLINLADEKYRVYLAKDIVLPCPWHRDRVVSALARIGSGKTFGPWEQDFANHHLTLWLPWRIAFVNGGNHSITAGIIAGEGSLLPEEVYDMSHIFQKVRCDGSHYWDIENHTKLGVVDDPRIAAVFEIGRLILRG